MYIFLPSPWHHFSVYGFLPTQLSLLNSSKYLGLDLIGMPMEEGYS